MPWQRLVLDVALEVDDGRPAFRDVVVTVPRQSGKTVLLLSLLLWRMLSQPGAQLVFGAQSRLTARTVLFDRGWPLIRRSAFEPMFTLSRGSGMETLRCANGSLLSLLSTEVSSGHGLTCDLVVIDEVWSLDASVEQAVRPTMAARPNAQLWLASTAGSFESQWFRSKVDAGRLHSQLAPGRAAYFEWSAADDADVTDPDGWWRYMPALTHTIDVETVQADFASMPIEEFARAYANRWAEDSGDVGWSVIPKDVWKSARLDG